MSVKEIAFPTRSDRGLRDLKFLRANEMSHGFHLDWLQTAERLSAEDCDEIITACHEFPLSTPETVGEENLPGHRQADPRKVGFTPRTKWLFDLLTRVAEASTASAFGLELNSISRSPQYVEYRPGWGRFDWHNDYSHGVPDAPRKLTIIIQLSDAPEYDGGRLEVFNHSVEELPVARGSILVFPSFLYHRVTPVTRGLRRALVAWIAGPRMS